MLTRVDSLSAPQRRAYYGREERNSRQEAVASLLGAVSESGRFRQGEENREWGTRRRRALKLATLRNCCFDERGARTQIKAPAISVEDRPPCLNPRCWQQLSLARFHRAFSNLFDVVPGKQVSRADIKFIK